MVNGKNSSPLKNTLACKHRFGDNNYKSKIICLQCSKPEKSAFNVPFHSPEKFVKHAKVFFTKEGDVYQKFPKNFLNIFATFIPESFPEISINFSENFLKNLIKIKILQKVWKTPQKL